MNRHLWIWHRRLGAVLAVVVILLCVTGVALNHTERLHLDERSLQADWLLDWYGVAAPDAGRYISAGTHDVALLGDHLYVDDTFIGAPFSDLIGAVRTDAFLVVAFANEMLVLADDLTIVERMGYAEGLPSDLAAIRSGDAGGLAVLDAAGETWVADRDIVAWQRADYRMDNWPEPAALGADRLRELGRDYRGRVLTLERLVLDLHSGRLFGLGGTWLMDIVAALMVVLAVSGLWLWTRSGR